MYLEASDRRVFQQCEMLHRLTWEGGQRAGVLSLPVWLFRRVFGLQRLVEGKKFSVPPIDEIFTPSFSLHLNHKPLAEKKTQHRSDIFVKLLEKSNA